jgi:DICT domain-containing protein/signal transduction histidine kinase
MSNPDSVVEALFQAIPQLRSQVFFKTSLTALSHAMEDQVLAGMDNPLVIASFQQERFYRQEASRYQRIADISDQVYVLSAVGTSFDETSRAYETITFEPKDALTHEWHLVVVGKEYGACLICREREPVVSALPLPSGPALDQNRRFEGVWSQDAQIFYRAAQILLDRILDYCPHLAQKIAQAKQRYLPVLSDTVLIQGGVGSDPFTQRLVTYLQAGQYKLLKAYKAIAIKEQRERLVNSITAAIRRSLNPEELFQITVDEVGQVLDVCRCIVYRYSTQLPDTTVRHEHRRSNEVSTLLETDWPLADNPLIAQIQRHQEEIVIPDTHNPDPSLQTALDALNYLIAEWNIQSWALIPLIYQQRLLGMIELHHCQERPYHWSEDDIALVEAVAAQLSVAIIQADAYAHLQDLNQQLEALERTRSNLIAITGHELRTPLSTIQVCLESLATEPDMPDAVRSAMLNSALEDAERMRKLVQDFLTLSRLESGRIEWNFEALALAECFELALSSVQARQGGQATCPAIHLNLPPKLPMVRVDGEWLVEVIVKLLDNACKFTHPDGRITISAQPFEDMVQVVIADTGRGIERDRLEAVFDRFYQEEGALRRTTGGTGLGLAMCRQIIEGLGGRIWATSAGKDQGSQFHFTLPIAEGRAALHVRHTAEEILAPLAPEELQELERNSPYILD